VGASAHVHVRDLNGVVSVAEPVPGRDFRLDVALACGRRSQKERRLAYRGLRLDR
jgi:hypothetical protein